jgi:NADPH:quinone reductase-like Zn-dependent oxidoreductase
MVAPATQANIVIRRLIARNRLVASRRVQGVFNSLSADFIAASFALLGEGGKFTEIGKRAIWAYERHQVACAASSDYSAIAFDAAWANQQMFVGATLKLLSKRASMGALHSLPLVSFDMEGQYELAFRTLQSGRNTGKIVLRITSRATGAIGGHAVTGGTSGLGLLTARWLAQHGARSLVLASRSGKLALGAFI